MKNNYKISHPYLDFSIEVEIDHSEKVDEYIKQMVQFWTDWEYNLEQEEGDYTKSFLKQLFDEIFGIQANRNHSTNGIISEFKNKEGYCPLEGSYGIKLIHVDTFNLESYELDIKTTKLEE